MIFKKKKNFFNKKKVSNIINYFKNIFSILFILQLSVIFFLVIWYFTHPIKYIYSPERIFKILNTKTKNLVGLEFNKIDDYIKIYLLSSYYHLFNPKIDKIDLKIDQKNMLELEFQRQNRSKILGSDDKIKEKLNREVKGSLVYNNEAYPIKLRVKGDRKIHYYKPLSTSYKIDLTKDNKIWGLEEFSLQKPIVRNYVYEFIFQKLHHEIGNISLQYSLVDLSINGQDYGLYSIEEGFSKELIERHGKRNGPIYGIKDDSSGLYPNIIYDGYSESSWLESDRDLLESGYAILNLIKKKDYNFSSYVDWDSWSKFFAVVDLMEAYHGSLAKSVRIYYNPVTGKIEPISFDGHYGTADFSDFIILDFLKESQNCSWICGEREWFYRFLYKEDNSIREEFLESYIKNLKIISSDNFLNNFKNKYAKEIENLNKIFYANFSKHDNIFWEGLFPYIYDESHLNKRADYIKKKITNINLSNIFFSKKNGKLNIEVSEKNISPFKIYPICEDGDKQKELWLNTTSTIEWNDNCKKLKIASIANTSKELNLIDNVILSQSIPKSFNNLPSIIEEIDGELKNNDFYPTKKIINIKKDLQLPLGINLIIQKNQKIEIENGSTLVLLGNLFANGSKDNKIIIEGIGPFYGSLISSDNFFEAKYLNIKNLLSPNIKGYRLYGGINFINSEVTLDNVNIINSLSEDGMNLINSKSTLVNLKFENSKSDALDIDSGNSIIDNLICENIGNDCLDFSNAEIKVDNLFAKNILDKSISIGESTRVKVANVYIENSEIGIAVKDNSKAEINNIEIVETKLPIAVFVKKNEYGPAELIVNDLKLNSTKKLFLVDNKSKLKINNIDYYGKESGSVVESYMYGNIYGKASIR